MIQFNAFPPEILNNVTELLTAYDTTNLVFTGDKNLLARLYNGGVTSFDLKFDQGCRMNWPKVVERFSALKRFTLKNDSPNPNTEVKKVDLYSLPSSLEVLHMSFENAEYAFLGVELVVEDAHPDPIWSPLTTANFEILPFPILERLPNLRSLRLDGNAALRDEFLTTLPPALTELALESNVYITLEGLKMLPPHLQTLDLSSNSRIDGIHKELPASLTHLSLGGLSQPAPNFLADLPRDLMYLDLSRCEHDFAEAWKTLPPALTFLKLPWNSSLGRHLADLPRGLLHLRADYQTPLTDKTVPDLPPGLRTLVLRETNELSNDSIHNLPRTLTKLDLRKSPNTTIGCIKNLPYGLKKLKMLQHMDLDAHTSPLPKTLEVLHCHNITQEVLSSLPSLIKLTVNGFTGDMLPAHFASLARLAHLTIEGNFTLTNELVAALPRTLKKLTLNGENQLKDESSSFLPPGLEYLQLFGNNKLGDEFVRSLPPRLIDLFLNYNTNITDKALEWLPRGLRIFVANNSPHFTDAGIPHLPRRLRDCRLEHAHLLTDQCAKDFPRSLTRLYMDRCKAITNNAMPYFPRTLTSLDLIQNGLVTEECLPNLPPRLEFFRVAASSVTSAWNSKTPKTDAVLEEFYHKQQK